ncbi:hypothetical protein [Hymenobacter coccineus]|uniref:Pentapeptide MXKDX repeat protein n=1 Tax=Hymenobacter coccineus TaxID=1908235 RepID=A0A1G1TKI8_9BACT|nr:hypothetical protein [Hymenobacter coccineus]OGX91372.1 hypothetical protein BEN49_05120 [Hymenobacter coccineus]
MKISLILAAAFALTASAASAQTVAPGTTPGAQTGNPSNMPSAGSTVNDQQTPATTNGKMDKMSGMDKGDKKMMRKDRKMKMNSDGSMKTKTKMQ